jgi:uncharacterized membrane protein YbhN (UPF0104 family)
MVLRRLDRGTLTLLLAMTALAFVGASAALALLLRCFGCSAAFPDIIGLVALIYLSSYIPLTFGSLGVREGVIVVGLALLGVDRHSGLAVAAMSRALLLVEAGMGGVVFLARRRQRTAVAGGTGED